MHSGGSRKRAVDVHGHSRRSTSPAPHAHRTAPTRRRDPHYAAERAGRQAGGACPNGPPAPPAGHPPRHGALHGTGLQRAAGGLQGVHGVRLLLDSQGVIWYVDQDHLLSPTAHAAITDPKNDLLVSAATLWEIAIK